MSLSEIDVRIYMVKIMNKLVIPVITEYGHSSRPSARAEAALCPRCARHRECSGHRAWHGAHPWRPHRLVETLESKQLTVTSQVIPILILAYRSQTHANFEETWGSWNCHWETFQSYQAVLWNNQSWNEEKHAKVFPLFQDFVIFWFIFRPGSYHSP